MKVSIPTEGTLELIHENWQDSQSAQWKLASDVAADVTPDDDDQNKQMITWIGKLTRLNVKKYADSDLDKGNLELKMTLQLSKEGEADQAVEIFSADNGEQWFASSDHTRKMVELRKQSIQPLVEEAPSLINGN